MLCGPEDASAVWAAGELGRRGVGVRLVTTEELVYSASLTHTVTRHRHVRRRAAWPTGRSSAPTSAARSTGSSGSPAHILAATPEPDRDYVLFELQAILASLLFALPGAVVGRADPRGLCGAWWRPAEWMVAAGRPV